jgi:DNA-binding transcriptional ArsR family regulator
VYSGASASGQNQRVPLSESALSQHLGILRDSGIVATARESRALIIRCHQQSRQASFGVLREALCPLIRGN